jgi:hypothetical protein
MRLTPRQRKLLIGLSLIALGLLVALIDLKLYMSPPDNDTMSYRAWYFGADHPGLVLMLGILLGHVWPVKRVRG